MRALLITFGIVAFFGGCATIQQSEAAQQEKWLLQAGFQLMKADTPEERASLANMTPYRIESKVQGDRVFYRYVNPGKGWLLLGGAQEFAAYRKIAASVKARRSANMSQITSSNSRVIGPMMW